jgi:L-lactate dehydrogenase
MIQKRTVAVVGTGSVGRAAAQALFVRRSASEILLVDKDEASARGEAMDLMHAQALVGRVSVRAVPADQLASAQVVVITAGRSQKRGESRLDLLKGNAEIVRDVMATLDRHAPEAVVVVATNPVDVLAGLAARETSRARGRVLGTGTTLDSARLRAIIGETYSVSPRSVHAYVLGEHGDSQVPIWSQAAIGGTRIAEGSVLGRVLDAATKEAMATRTRTAAREIIALKGRTDSAIGVVISHLVEAILADEQGVHPLSVPLEGEYGLTGVCLGIPCVLASDGVVARMAPELDAGERAALHRSADLLREATRSIGG